MRITVAQPFSWTEDPDTVIAKATDPPDLRTSDTEHIGRRSTHALTRLP